MSASPEHDTVVCPDIHEIYTYTTRRRHAIPRHCIRIAGRSHHEQDDDDCQTNSDANQGMARKRGPGGLVRRLGGPGCGTVRLSNGGLKPECHLGRCAGALAILCCELPSPGNTAASLSAAWHGGLRWDLPLLVGHAGSILGCRAGVDIRIVSLIS